MKKSITQETKRGEKDNIDNDTPKSCAFFNLITMYQNDPKKLDLIAEMIVTLGPMRD